MKTRTFGQRVEIAFVLRAALAFGAGLAAVGCAADAADVEPEHFDTISEADVVPNGQSLNGVQLNGVQLNGVQLNGVQLNGVQLNGVQLEGGLLAAYTAGGQKLAGSQLAGATFTAALANNTTVQIRIDDVVPTADPLLFFYGASFELGGSWMSMCGYKNGAPVRAVALAGIWDASMGTATGGAHIDNPSMFTFACRGFSLAKCVEMGYRPWASVHECKSASECQDVPGAALHQACVRMLRADYCGDGMPHTLDGTPIDVWDAFKIQIKDPNDWTLEAEWTAGGARCIDHVRWTFAFGGNALDYVNAHCKSRWAFQQPSYDCGGAGSTLYTQNGYAMDPMTRALIMDSSDD
jgi:hypothetical protein